jgi:hypothetical protein
MENIKKQGVIVNQPSEETKRKMVEFFMKTSVPRILAAIERGELILDENGNIIEVSKDGSQT